MQMSSNSVRGSPALADLVTEQLAAACDSCCSVVVRMVALVPQVHDCDQMAKRLGYDGRTELSPALGRHGFPPLNPLEDWIMALRLLDNWERTHAPLVRQAWNNGVEPSVLHRTIRRVTGTGWTEARDTGLLHWVQVFGIRVGDHLKCHYRTLSSEPKLRS